MTTEEIVQNYQVELLKITFKEIDSLMEKKEKVNTNVDNSSDYWKSVGEKAVYIKEMYEKFSVLAEIDRIFHWSSRLHQKQLQFVSEYPKVMEEYRQVS